MLFAATPCGGQGKCAPLAGGLKSSIWGGAAHSSDELCTGKSLPLNKPEHPKEREPAEMATHAEQLPHLHLAELTAAQFIDIWKHFDTDGQWIQLWVRSIRETTIYLIIVGFKKMFFKISFLINKKKKSNNNH